MAFLNFAKKIRPRFNELRRHPAYRRNPHLIWGRVFCWVGHCALQVPARAQFKRWDFTIIIPPKWSGGGGTQPFLFREYFQPGLLLLERFLNPGMTFVDAGANTGSYTFTAARLVGPAGKVLAFEPGIQSFVALQKSLELNRFEQVVLRRQALSDRTGSAMLYHIKGKENQFGLGPSVDPDIGFEDIETITLEQALTELGLRRIDFLKLDVEGSQELILRSSRKLLSDCNPIMLIENNPSACRRLNLDPEGTWQLLCELYYGFFNSNDSGQVYPIANPRGFRNLLAVYEESPLFKELHQ